MGAEGHDLVLILARGLASSVASPIFIVDPEGTLVFFNEAAETVLGRPYAEAGRLTLEEWGGAMFEPKDPATGDDLPAAAMPLTKALRDRRPAHRAMRITGLDGAQRTIEVTAFPLFARTDEFIGAVAIFWEEQG